MNDQINLSIVSAEEDEESGGTENEMSGDNNGPCEDNSGDHCIVVSRNDIAQSGQLLDATAEVQWEDIPVAEIVALPIEEENDGPWANPAIRL